MGSVMKDLVEKMMEMEVKIKQGEEERKRRETEMEMVWKALLGFKKIVDERESEVESLKSKIEKMEEEKRREMEEIWKELDIWNNEWMEHLRNDEEKEEKEKWKSFNDRRDEERRENNRKCTRESLKALWSIVRRYEVDLGLAKTEAREMIAELLEKVESLNKNDKQIEVSKEMIKEKNDEKNRWKKKRLALTWPSVGEKAVEKESEKEE